MVRDLTGYTKELFCGFREPVACRADDLMHPLAIAWATPSVAQCGPAAPRRAAVPDVVGASWNGRPSQVANRCSITYYDVAVPVQQGDLFTGGEAISFGRPEKVQVRTVLAWGAWVDLRRGWLCGADGLFERLQAGVPWRHERRPMYQRMVDVPRLSTFYDEGDELPDAALEEIRGSLSDLYAGDLGEPFASVGLALYRDGADSVAWHGDTVGRASREDTVVAIVSLGAHRRLHLRPRGGGASLRFDLAPGDLFVMGGSCQRTWEHAVPKTKRPVGARISVQLRPRGVR